MTQLRLEGLQAGGKSEARGVSLTLNPVEAKVAEVVATGTEDRALARNAVDRRVDISDSVATRIQSSGAELAVSRLTQCRWLGMEDYAPDLPDLWPNVEVKWTPRANGGLLIPAKSPPDRIYFLALGEIPTFTVVGWIRGREGMTPRYWREDVPKPCWIIPQEDLRPPLAP